MVMGVTKERNGVCHRAHLDRVLACFFEEGGQGKPLKKIEMAQGKQDQGETNEVPSCPDLRRHSLAGLRQVQNCIWTVSRVSTSLNSAPEALHSTLVPALMGTKLRKAFQAEATSSTKEKKKNNSGTGEAQCVSGTEIVSVFGVELKSPTGTREA